MGYNPPDGWLTMRQVAALYGVPLRTVQYHAKIGALIVERRGKRIHVTTKRHAAEYAAQCYGAGPITAAVQRAGVYAVCCEGFIKIGFTADWAHRESVLSALLPYPMKVLTFIELPTGEQARLLEKTLHREFRDLRHHHEWFHDAARIRMKLESLTVVDCTPLETTSAATV